MFSEIIVALYESDADADAAVAEMLAAGVPLSSIHRHSKAGTPGPAPRGAGHEPGFWSRLFGGHSSDHAVYDQALHNGRNVLTVADVPGHDMGPVTEILERHNPVNIDEQAVNYTGIAHDPDPVVSGRDDPAAAPRSGDPLVNQGGPRVRRFSVVARPGDSP